MRTRVGYSGGRSPNPTYRSMGDHSECIQIDFDPAVISYPQLLSLARAQGNFGQASGSKQYRSVVFYHNDQQREIARKAGLTELEPASLFTRAEDYHQKYYLQQSDWAADFFARYPNAQAFTDSTAVARANGIAGGHFDAAHLNTLIPSLGVSESTAQAMLDTVGTSAPGCAVK